MKILYTGSLGFIFSNLIRRAAFEKRPYTFCGIDRANNLNQIDNVYNNKIISNNYLADINDTHILDKIFKIENPDIIIHGATDNSAIDCAIKTNILGTQNLVNAAKIHGVKKILYLSTDKLYASSNINDASKSSEDSIIDPKNIYSISQLAAENLIINSGIDYNILRIGDVYGPRQNCQNLIPSIIKSIIENKNIKIVNGMDVLDWSHVFDVSAAILTIVEKNLHNQIINVSSNQECSIVEITQFVCNAFKQGHNLIIPIGGSQTGIRYSMNNTKLFNLGWKPMFKLKQGIEEVVNWYQINQWSLK